MLDGGGAGEQVAGGAPWPCTHRFPPLRFPPARTAGAHSDYGIMTILATDDEGGLEFYMPDSGWAAVPPK